MSAKDSRKKWIKNNPEKYRVYKAAKDKRSYARHRVNRLAKIREYAATHRKEAVERVARWRAANRARCNTINANRRAREAGAEGYYTTGEWEQLKIQYAFKCAACGRREPEIKLTRDHIIPLSRGGSNFIENIQPLCGQCNCIKHAKMPDNLE